MRAWTGEKWKINIVGALSFTTGKIFCLVESSPKHASIEIMRGIVRHGRNRQEFCLFVRVFRFFLGLFFYEGAVF
jgi:hypothetical protein